MEKINLDLIINKKFEKIINENFEELIDKVNQLEKQNSILTDKVNRLEKKIIFLLIILIFYIL